MTPRTPIDPELRVLLEEIAADPKAKLFRTEIPRPERLLLTGVEPLGPAATGLTSAEHHLLHVWRDDVAKLLRDAAEWKLQQDPLGAAQVIQHTSPEQREPTPDGALLARALEREPEDLREETVRRHVRLGRALLRSSDGSAHQLAALSLRMVPHGTAWIHMGRALILEGRLALALQVLFAVARRDESARIRASALTWIATAFGCAGLSGQAALAYSTAARAEIPGPTALFGWFAEALFTGDVELSRQAAERIDPYLAPNSPGSLEWVHKLNQRLRLDARLGIREEARPALAFLGGRVGPTSQMVIDALQ